MIVVCLCIGFDCCSVRDLGVSLRLMLCMVIMVHIGLLFFGVITFGDGLIVGGLRVEYVWVGFLFVVLEALWRCCWVEVSD